MCVLNFSTNFLFEKFLILRRIERVFIKNIFVSYTNIQIGDIKQCLTYSNT